jgi:type II secretory pathway component PulM
LWLLWDEAVNRLAREQSDLLEEMGLQAPEYTIQVGCYFVVIFVTLCYMYVLLWDEAVDRLTREQSDLLEEMGLQAPEDTIQVLFCCYICNIVPHV